MFFGRSADEYQRLWNLRIDDLRGRAVLDCPCGPSTFVPTCRAAGVRATGADPVLAGIPDSIESRGIADIDDTLDLIRKQDPALASQDPKVRADEKRQALERFVADFRRHGPDRPGADGRYLAAALPSPPITDREIGLVLFAHLLFCGAGTEHGGMVENDAALDLEIHLRAIDELVRIARSEIRLYPALAINTENPSPHPWLAAVRSRLEKHGLTSRTVDTAYEQDFGTADAILIATRD